MTTTQIPAPEGTSWADDWTELDGEVGRFVHWPNIDGLPDGVEIAETGWQRADGTVARREMWLSGHRMLTPDEFLALADAMGRAAHRL